jgi:hypothetical protein
LLADASVSAGLPLVKKKYSFTTAHGLGLVEKYCVPWLQAQLYIGIKADAAGISIPVLIISVWCHAEHSGTRLGLLVPVPE